MRDGQTEGAEDASRQVAALPPLPLAEALERFRVDGPVDLDALREAWQDEAAKDVIGE